MATKLLFLFPITWRSYYWEDYFVPRKNNLMATTLLPHLDATGNLGDFCQT